MAKRKFHPSDASHPKLYEARRRPPTGEPFIWLTQEMIDSAAFRALPVNGFRALFRIISEFSHHAGHQNGHLMVTYNDFVRAGIPRSEIALAIATIEALGFVRCARGKRVGVEREPNAFRLTWLPTKECSLPTNEWKGVENAKAREIVKAALSERKETRRAKRQRRAKPEAKKEPPVGQSIIGSSTTRTRKSPRKFDNSHSHKVGPANLLQ